MSPGLRDTEAFEQLQAQIAQIDDVHATSGVDWGTVLTQARAILETQGADLAVGVWQVVASLKVERLPGFADAMHVLRTIIVEGWDSFAPPQHRMRARRGLVEWLMDQLTPLLADIDGELDEQAWAGLQADWAAIDTFWAERDAEAPALGRFKRVLAGLPLRTPAPQTAAVASSASTESQLLQSASQPASQSPQSGSQPLRCAPEAGIAEAFTGAGVGDEHAIELALNTRLSSLRPVVDYAITNFPAYALAYRFNRILAWSLIDSLPEADNDITHLPPPASAERDLLTAAIEGGDAHVLLDFAESRLVDAPFWLDLCRHAHEALTRLGEPQAAAVVADETLAFTRRLSGIERLCFSDSAPLADKATRNWLEAMSGDRAQASPGPQSSQSAQGAEQAISIARRSAVEGHLDDAIEGLERFARGAPGERERFMARLGQCELLGEFGGRGALHMLALPLVRSVEAFGLERWEPVLAARAWQFALEHAALETAERSDWLSSLAGVDLNAAWRLVRE